MLCQQIMMSSSFFRLMVDLEQSGTWILDPWSMILKFSLIATFYFAKKVKIELKNLYHSSHTTALSIQLLFLQINTDVSKTKRVLILEEFLPLHSPPLPPPTNKKQQKKPLKSPPRLVKGDKKGMQTKTVKLSVYWIHS